MTTSKRDFLTLKGISYIIYTDGDIQNVRESQPCYGELRKYEKTHPGECTQPENKKPGDLHSPFPAGTPTMLEVPFFTSTYGASTPSDATDRLFLAFFGVTSPWVAGFGEVEFVKGAKGHIEGIRIPDLTIDTTVTVNSFKNFRQCLSKATDFIELTEAGLTGNEAIAVMMLNGGVSYKQGIANTSTYSACKYFSPKRFFRQTPNDLTGGFLKDRVDYNRTLMQDPFQGSLETGAFEWNTKMTSLGLPRYGTGSIQTKDLVPVVKKAFGEGIDNEQEPVLTPFVWKTTSGKIRDEHTISAGR